MYHGVNESLPLPFDSATQCKFPPARLIDGAFTSSNPVPVMLHCCMEDISTVPAQFTPSGSHLGGAVENGLDFLIFALLHPSSTIQFTSDLHILIMTSCDFRAKHQPPSVQGLRSESSSTG